jgi:hypothetical protein
MAGAAGAFCSEATVFIHDNRDLRSQNMNSIARRRRSSGASPLAIHSAVAAPVIAVRINDA